MEIKPMIETIVRELFQAWQREPVVHPPKVLYIFCDSTALEAYTDHFIHLNKSGVCHDILFLDGETSAWLGMNKLECGGPGKIITADEFAPVPLEVPRDYEGIILPEIDLDNAARVALGMKGTIKSEIIFSALVQGKFVLVGEDSPGLKRSDRRALKTLTLSKPYNNLLAYYKRELQMYGVEFGPQKRLAELAVNLCVKEQANRSAEAADKSQQTSDNLEQLTFEGKLVSAEWVRAQIKKNKFETLVVQRKTIISPLAMDLLKENWIAVMYADEG
jgi:hypothetical protein